MCLVATERKINAFIDHHYHSPLTTEEWKRGPSQGNPNGETTVWLNNDAEIYLPRDLSSLAGMTESFVLPLAPVGSDIIPSLPVSSPTSSHHN